MKWLLSIERTRRQVEPATGARPSLRASTDRHADATGTNPLTATGARP